MTIRTMIQLVLYLVGGGLMVALWRTGTPLEANIGWYVIGALIVMTGYAPKDSFWLASSLALVIFGVVFTGFSESVFKLGVPVAFFLVGLAGVAHWLSSPAEVNLVQCESCRWRGNARRVHFGRCPACGSLEVSDSDQKILSRL